MTSKENIISKHSGAFATIIAAIIGAGVLLYISLYKNNEPVPSAANDNTYKSKNTLTAKDVLTTLESKKLTKLQKSQFIKRNQGAKVQWRVIVNDVTAETAGSDKQAFYLVFHPAYQKEKTFPTIILASFSIDKENELSSLSEGDSAVIEGKLKLFNNLLYKVSLEESNLIKFTKRN